MKNKELKITGKLMPDAKPSKPVIYGNLYFLPKSVYYFSSYLLRKVTFLSRPAGEKFYFPLVYEGKNFFTAVKNFLELFGIDRSSIFSSVVNYSTLEVIHKMKKIQIQSEILINPALAEEK